MDFLVSSLDFDLGGIVCLYVLVLVLALLLGPDDAIDLKMLVEGSGIGVVGALVWILPRFIIINFFLVVFLRLSV